VKALAVAEDARNRKRASVSNGPLKLARGFALPASIQPPEIDLELNRGFSENPAPNLRLVGGVVSQ
jgi:hypothetical protein